MNFIFCFLNDLIVLGMILLSELTRLRMRSIHKLVRVGRREVARILRVDPTKRYVDLSRRQISKEELAEANERFTRGRTVSQRISIRLNEKATKIFEGEQHFTSNSEKFRTEDERRIRRALRKNGLVLR